MPSRSLPRILPLCALLLMVFAPACGAAPADPKIDRPAGTPRGIVLVIHGGAWRKVGRDAVASMRGEARRFRRRGWITHVIDHRRLHRSYGDVQAYFDRLRRRHPRTRICAYGTSSGGHLALMLAQRRPSLSCVIAVGAPSDLVRWPAAYRGVDAALTRLDRRVSLARWSPARHAAQIRQPALLVHDPADGVVPYAQSARLARALPRGRLVALCPGPIAYVHTRVAVDCLRRAFRAEAALLRRVR
jgi:dipeptidyl aminopeptidase/acylaminoacyl peptidase